MPFVMENHHWDLLSSYAGLFSLACISIYAGSFGSLPRFKSENGKESDKALDEDEDEDFTLSEHLSSSDAWLFPILGSVFLFSLYIIVKYFGTAWINWLLGWYFSFTGVASVWKAGVSLVRFILGPARWRQFEKTSIIIKRGSNTIVSVRWRTPSLLLFPLAMVPSAIYSLSAASRKPVLIANILTLSFSHNALSLLKIDSFQTGTVLLSGLFFYDIWWVFGTEVMLKVATNLDAPIKLLWPKSLIFSEKNGFTMLGLGDVVIPGTFIALALRYDYDRSLRNKSVSNNTFAKPYFYAALIAYALGLATTMSVMHIFGKGQPALLYLSPACILSFFITASFRGELYGAWAWRDNAGDTKADGSLEKKAE